MIETNIEGNENVLTACYCRGIGNPISIYSYHSKHAYELVSASRYLKNRSFRTDLYLCFASRHFTWSTLTSNHSLSLHGVNAYIRSTFIMNLKYSMTLLSITCEMSRTDLNSLIANTQMYTMNRNQENSIDYLNTFILVYLEKVSFLNTLACWGSELLSSTSSGSSAQFIWNEKFPSVLDLILVDE